MHGYELHFSASNIEANATVRLTGGSGSGATSPSRRNRLCYILGSAPDNALQSLVQGVFNKESMIMKLLQEASVEEVG